jgi:nucleoside-diphosphate-sugar epimerase
MLILPQKNQALYMKSKVLVTGGAGYIGSVLVRILLEQGYKVRAIDYLAFGGESLIEIYDNPNFEFIKGDIRDENVLSDALESIDAVCHLAAIVGDPACKKFTDDAYSINWEGSVKLYELCKQKGVKRFVFASTCSNYGKMTDPSSYVHEDSELRPVSLYAELKVKFEKYLLTQKAESKVCTTVLRFSTVYGISPRMRFDLTVNEFTRDVALGKELVIFGEQFWRPYCHVYDLANSVATVLNADAQIVNGEVFNVGDTSENYSKKMLATEISKVADDVSIKYVQQVDDPRDYRVNFSKISKALDYKITKTVPDGIKEIYEIVKLGIVSEPNSKRYSNI